MIYVSDSDLLGDGQLGQRPIKPCSCEGPLEWKQARVQSRRRRIRRTQSVIWLHRSLFSNLLVAFPPVSCCSSVCFFCFSPVKPNHLIAITAWKRVFAHMRTFGSYAFRHGFSLCLTPPCHTFYKHKSLWLMELLKRQNSPLPADRETE